MDEETEQTRPWGERMIEMFDIIKAANAANRKVNSAKALSTLMRRLQSLCVAQIQWRTMGEDTEMASAFLDELGFKCGEDYEKYTSCLDGRVVDFKWNPAGKILELSESVSAMRNADPRKFGALPVIAWLKPSELHWETAAPEEPAPAAARPRRSVWPARLESITKAKTEAVLPLIRSLSALGWSEGDAQPSEHPWINVRSGASRVSENGRTVFFNGVSKETLTDLHEYLADNPPMVIPDLWVAEAINRLLPPDEASPVPPPPRCADLPDDMMFGPFGIDETECLFDDDDRMVTKHSTKVLMRYFGIDDEVKGANVLLSGIAAQELLNPPYLDSPASRGRLLDARDAENALSGYLTNDAAVTDSLDVSLKPIAFAVTTCAFAPDRLVEAFVRGTDPSFLWCYVQWIYMQFFGPEFRVGIEPHARVAFGPSFFAWRNYYGSWSPSLEAQAGMAGLPAVTFAFVVTPLQISDAVDPRKSAPEIPPVEIQVAGNPAADEERAALAMCFRIPDDDAALWFTLTHKGKVRAELKSLNHARGADPTAASANLAWFRATYRCEAFREAFHDHVEGLSDPTTNPMLAPTVAQDGDLRFNLASGLLSGVSAVINGSWSTADGSRTPNLIKAVYSYIGDGGEFEALDSATPQQIDAWLSCISTDRQLQVPPRTENDWFMLVYETNVDYPCEPVHWPQFFSDIKDVVHSTLISSADCEVDPLEYRENAGYISRYFVELVKSEAERFIDSTKYADMCTGGFLDRMQGAVGRNLTGILVKVCKDSRGKASVVIAVSPRHAAVYLALYCVRAGLPLAMTDWVAPHKVSGLRADVRERAAVVFADEDQLKRTDTALNEVIRFIIQTTSPRRSRLWTCCRESSRRYTWGYGPLHSCFHIRDSHDSVARRDYLYDDYSWHLRFADVVRI